MPYALRLTDQAKAEINSFARWYNKQHLGIGEEWLLRIEIAIKTLEEQPERCPLAHETDLFPCDLRELLFGSGRRKTHRILFSIGSNEVVILGVRHTSQSDFTIDGA